MTICSANLKRDVDTFGKQDPFVTLSLAEQFWNWKSKVIESGGKTPNWNETVEIPIKNQEQDMLLKVMDDDLGSLEEMVCSALVPIKSLCASAGFDGDIKLDFKGKDSGTIRLKASFVPDKSPKRQTTKKMGAAESGTTPVRQSTKSKVSMDKQSSVKKDGKDDQRMNTVSSKVNSVAQMDDIPPENMPPADYIPEEDKQNEAEGEADKPRDEKPAIEGQESSKELGEK